MRSHLLPGSALGALAVTSALVAATALPAQGDTPYTVVVGQHSTGATTFTGATTGQIVLTDVTAAGSLSCTSGTISGRVKLGSRAAGAGLLRVNDSTWTGCQGPLGIQLQVQQVPGASWRFGGTAPVDADGTIVGAVHHVTLTVSDPNGNSSFTAGDTGGGPPARRAVATLVQQPAADQELQLGTPDDRDASSLIVGGVVGCFGLVNNGDKLVLTANYQLTTKTQESLAISNG